MDSDLPAELRRYPPKEIAALWAVNARTVHRWIADGLPADNVGSGQRPDYRIRPVDVSPYLWRRLERTADAVSSSDD